jgi:hypothetical protein
MKLMKLISEIRQGPSPELVDRLDTEIFGIYRYSDQKSHIAGRLRHQYLKNSGWNINSGIKVDEWIKGLSPKSLLELYNEMKRVKKILDEHPR